MFIVSFSSNSSGFFFDYDMDLFDGRNMIKRNSDLDSFVYVLVDFFLFKCKKYVKFNIWFIVVYIIFMFFYVS